MAQKLNTQIHFEEEKDSYNRWKTKQDTQDKIFEIQQGISVNQAKTEDKAFDKWSDYIRRDKIAPNMNNKTQKFIIKPYN